ncbi:MAG: sodium ion-translocating decarboxylase subunit beta [Paludibacteraceae bacterium]|nr:sodium ion-translocating decarboxylase subunit beta [Paludibacteraceae bacterium]
MRFKIITLGCKLNFAESSALGKVLIDRGHSRCKAGETADVVIVNTCTVTDPSNFLLMHAMGPNVAGVIGSAVAAGILLTMLG